MNHIRFTLLFLMCVLSAVGAFDFSGQYISHNTIKKQLGKECLRNSDCEPEFSECVDFVCSCTENFKRSVYDNKECVPEYMRLSTEHVLKDMKWNKQLHDPRSDETTRLLQKLTEMIEAAHQSDYKSMETPTFSRTDDDKIRFNVIVLLRNPLAQEDSTDTLMYKRSVKRALNFNTFMQTLKQSIVNSAKQLGININPPTIKPAVVGLDEYCFNQAGCKTSTYGICVKTTCICPAQRVKVVIPETKVKTCYEKVAKGDGCSFTQQCTNPQICKDLTCQCPPGLVDISSTQCGTGRQLNKACRATAQCLQVQANSFCNANHKCACDQGYQETNNRCIRLTEPTEAPSTEPPSTETPSTQIPSTETPSTEPPSTETPATEVPSTETPTTEIPSTETPSTETTSTETTSTETPSTETPSTETPSTETPSTETPSTETPSTEIPSTETPTEKPSTETPSTEIPSTEATSTETTSTETPTEKPSTETPSTEASSTETPSTETPTEKPYTETPSTETTSTETPSTETPSTETPSTETPTTEIPSTETPSTEVPSTETTSTETTSTETPSTETPSTETPSTETPSTETPSTETPSTEKPSTETQSTETTSTETPSTETPSTETPSTETPSTETPSTETPSTETPSTETPSTTLSETNSTEVPATESPNNATKQPASNFTTTEATTTETTTTETTTTETTTTETTTEITTTETTTTETTTTETTTETTTTTTTCMASVLNGSCDATCPCTPANSICVDKQCSCIPGYVSSGNGCLEVLNVGDICGPLPLSNLCPSFSVCNGTCVCNTGYFSHYLMGCLPYVDLYESCVLSDQCPSNADCTQGVTSICECSTGFAQSVLEQGTCVTETISLDYSSTYPNKNYTSDYENPASELYINETISLYTLLSLALADAGYSLIRLEDIDYTSGPNGTLAVSAKMVITNPATLEHVVKRVHSPDKRSIHGYAVDMTTSVYDTAMKMNMPLQDIYIKF